MTEGEGGAAAEGPKPSASSPARPTTAPSVTPPDQQRGLPASGSTPRLAEGAAYTDEQAPVGSSSRGTGSVGKAAQQAQQPAAMEVSQERGTAAGGQAGAAGGRSSGQDAAAVGESGGEAPGAAGPVAAAGEPGSEAAGSNGPAAAAIKAEPHEPVAAPSGRAGGQQQQAGEEAAAGAGGQLP